VNARRWLSLLVLCLLPAACAHEMGENAMRGATQGLRQEAAELGRPNAPPTSVAAANVVWGSLYALNEDPRGVAALNALTQKLTAEAVRTALATATAGTGMGEGSPVEVISEQVVRTVQAQLLDALGGRGNGPLAQTLTATSTEMAAAAARSAAGNLLPGCDPRQSPGCVERQVAELAQTTGAGVIRGIKQEIRWVAVAGIFLAGLVSAFLLMLAWQLATTRRALREARALGPRSQRPVGQE